MSQKKFEHRGPKKPTGHTTVKGKNRFFNEEIQLGMETREKEKEKRNQHNSIDFS